MFLLKFCHFLRNSHVFVHKMSFFSGILVVQDPPTGTPKITFGGFMSQPTEKQDPKNPNFWFCKKCNFTSTPLTPESGRTTKTTYEKNEKNAKNERFVSTKRIFWKSFFAQNFCDQIFWPKSSGVKFWPFFCVSPRRNAKKKFYTGKVAFARFNNMHTSRTV